MAASNLRLVLPGGHTVISRRDRGPSTRCARFRMTDGFAQESPRSRGRWRDTAGYGGIRRDFVQPPDLLCRMPGAMMAKGAMRANV
jgi:hypothetical protein